MAGLILFICVFLIVHLHTLPCSLSFIGSLRLWSLLSWSPCSACFSSCPWIFMCSSTEVRVHAPDFKNFDFILCVWVFCLHVCLCTMWVQCSRRLEESLDRKLWADMWMPGIEPRCSARATGALNHPAISPGPPDFVDRLSSSLHWLRLHYIAKDDSLLFLPLIPNDQDYRCEPPHSDTSKCVGGRGSCSRWQLVFRCQPTRGMTLWWRRIPSGQDLWDQWPWKLLFLSVISHVQKQL